jgi:hypothetical protein
MQQRAVAEPIAADTIELVVRGMVAVRTALSLKAERLGRDLGRFATGPAQSPAQFHAALVELRGVTRDLLRIERAGETGQVGIRYASYARKPAVMFEPWELAEADAVAAGRPLEGSPRPRAGS